MTSSSINAYAMLTRLMVTGTATGRLELLYSDFSIINNSSLLKTGSGSGLKFGLYARNFLNILG